MLYPLTLFSFSNTLHTFEQHIIHSHFWAILSYRQWISNVQHFVSKQTSELSSKTTMPAMLHWQRFAHRSRFMWLPLHSIVFCTAVIYICTSPGQVWKYDTYQCIAMNCILHCTAQQCNDIYLQCRSSVKIWYLSMHCNELTHAGRWHCAKHSIGGLWDQLWSVPYFCLSNPKFFPGWK